MRLRARRDERGVQLPEIAAGVGLNVQRIRNIEHGKTVPDEALAAAILDTLQVTGEERESALALRRAAEQRLLQRKLLVGLPSKETGWAI